MYIIHNEVSYNLFAHLREVMNLGKITTSNRITLPKLMEGLGEVEGFFRDLEGHKNQLEAEARRLVGTGVQGVHAQLALDSAYMGLQHNPFRDKNLRELFSHAYMYEKEQKGTDTLSFARLIEVFVLKSIAKPSYVCRYQSKEDNQRVKQQIEFLKRTLNNPSMSKWNKHKM